MRDFSCSNEHILEYADSLWKLSAHKTVYGKEMVTRIPGYIIRRYRERKGITQGALAEALNVVQATVSRWEREEQTPDLSATKQLIRMIYGTDALASGEAAAMFLSDFPGVAAILTEDYSVVATSPGLAGVAEGDAKRLLGVPEMMRTKRQLVAEVHQANEILFALTRAGATETTLKLQRSYIPIVINGREHLIVVVFPAVPGLP